MTVGVVEQWPSLADQNDLAHRVFGPSGPQKLRRWVAEQTSRVGNDGFARTFSDHVQLPGIHSMDYAHRHIRTARGNVLGGIRFYARDTARPFVAVLAHSFDDVDTLAPCVFSEWSAFEVRYLRLRTSPHLLAGRRDVLLDKSIHLARCHDMAPADGRVHLERFDDVEHAVHLVTDRYTHLAQTNPTLAHNLSPASDHDLRHWHEHDQLWAIRRAEATIGAFAVAPGAIGWITGHEINEEVINTAHAGNNYATSTQCAWAHRQSSSTNHLLIGTIDRHNHASRATAERAGRPRVLDDVFIRLTSQTDLERQGRVNGPKR